MTETGRPPRDDGQDEKGGEEVRSPLQATVRVLLAVIVVAVLAGLILAVVLRPERLIEPPAENPGTVWLGAQRAAQPAS